MTQAETRTVGYAIAGSLAVHLLLAATLAVWVGLSSFHHIHFPKPVEEEPEVTLVFPEPTPLIPVVPVPVEPKKEERYIRTTQNTEATQAPAKPDFVSDKDTVAMTKAGPSPDGDKPLPTMQGVDFQTTELANRTFRDGQTKNDSAPSPPKPSPATAVATPPPAPPPPPPQMKVPEPQIVKKKEDAPAEKMKVPEPQIVKKKEDAPAEKMKVPEPQIVKKKEDAPAEKMKVPEPQIVKKEDAPAEKMMKELDAALAKTTPDTKLPELRKPEETRDALPLMRTPEDVSVPKAIPVAAPVANTPRPEKDAFQPETRRSTVKGTISNVGSEDSVNAAATPVGRYMRQVTSAIEKKWHQFRRARAGDVEPGKMGLRFFVNKNGKVENLEFLFKESNPLMEDFTIEAILKAEIPPIPKDLLPMLEKERVEITYDIVIHP